MMVEKNAEHETGTGTGVVLDVRGSLWRRYRTTPWGDLLRGRLSGRYDVDARIGGSGLPVAVCEFLTRVMKKVGLRGGERIDVVDELIAHFRDGIARGEDVNDIIRSFGEVKKIAKLIRRAKKRNRSIAWKMWVRGWQGLGALVCLLVVWYVGALFYYFSGRVVISHDYLADITAKARAVPEGERAWPVYREALMEIQPDLIDENYIGGSPGQYGWEKTVSAIEKHPGAIAKLRRAAAMPGLGYIVGHGGHDEDQALWAMGYQFEFENSFGSLNGSIYGLQGRQLEALHVAHALLSADLVIGREHDDGDRVFRDIEALLNMYHHYQESPTWSASLRSAIYVSMDSHIIGDVVAVKPKLLSDEVMEEVAHRLSTADTEGRGGAIRIDIKAVVMAMKDIIQRCYTDDGSGSGHLNLQGIRALRPFGYFSTGGTQTRGETFLEPVIAATAMKRSALEKRLGEMADEYNARSCKPMWEWSIDKDLDYTRGPKGGLAGWAHRDSFLNYFWIDRGQVIEVGEESTQQRDAVLTAIGLELYRRDHGGAYPEALNELVPKYLPVVPRDRYDGKALKYHFVDGRPMIYSVFIDHRDDGGIEMEARKKVSIVGKTWVPPSEIEEEGGKLYGPNWLGERVEIPRGDWILWESGKTEAEIHPRNY